MIRTQIQLPDELYQRAKSFAEEREISLAEVTRRGIELFLDRFPQTKLKGTAWQLPRVEGGSTKIPLAKLSEISADE